MTCRVLVWFLLVVFLVVAPAVAQEEQVEPEGSPQAPEPDVARIDRQIEQLRAYLEKDPSRSVVYRRLLGLLQTRADVARESGEVPAGPSYNEHMRTVAEAWVRQHPGEPDAVIALASYQSSNKEREGILTTAVRRFPDNLHAHQLLAHALADRDPRSGAAVLDRFLMHHPDDREALVSLLLYCQTIGDRQRMRAALDSWLERHPDDPQALKPLLMHFGDELAEAELIREVELLLAGAIGGSDHVELCAVVLRRNLSELGRSCSDRALRRTDVQADRPLFFLAQQYFIWSCVLLREWREADRVLSSLKEVEAGGLRLSMARALARLRRCEDIARLLDPIDPELLKEEQRQEVLEIRSGCGERHAGYRLWRQRLEEGDAQTLSDGLRQIRELIPLQEFFEIMLRKLDEAPDRTPFLEVLVPYLFGLPQELRSSQEPLLAAWLAYRSARPDRQPPQWLLEDLVTAVYGRGLQVEEVNRPVAEVVEALLQHAGIAYQLDASVARRVVSISLVSAAWPQHLDTLCAMAGCTWQVRGGTPATVEIHARALQHPTVSVVPGPVDQVLRGIAEAIGYGIDLDPRISGTLRLNLGEIEWPTALDLVCRHAGCRWSVSDNAAKRIEVRRIDHGQGN